MPKSSIDPIVVRNLKIALERRGRSAYSVAKALGRSSNWLYQVLEERYGLLIPSLREIARELEVSMGSLVDAEEDIPKMDDHPLTERTAKSKKTFWPSPTGEVSMTISPSIQHIRGRIAEIGILQADLAIHLGIHESLLNAHLRGRRPMTEELEERIHAALNLIERAKRAGRKAERKVMREGQME